jgi:hypothetical protein
VDLDENPALPPENVTDLLDISSFTYSPENVTDLLHISSFTYSPENVTDLLHISSFKKICYIFWRVSKR